MGGTKSTKGNTNNSRPELDDEDVEARNNALEKHPFYQEASKKITEFKARIEKEPKEKTTLLREEIVKFFAKLKTKDERMYTEIFLSEHRKLVSLLHRKITGETIIVD